MSRLFRLTSRKNGTDDDMMTISGFSMGGSSVSDRIMGRMRMSLTGIGGRNFASGGGSEASGSADSGGRRSMRSKPSFTRTKRRSSSVGRLDMPGLDAAGSSVRAGGSGSKNMIDGMMSQMDSNETMALTGRSMGRRAPSAPTQRSRSMADDRFGKSRQGKQNKSKGRSHTLVGKAMAVEPPPMEFSLAQLRQMSELELERIIQKVGVPSEEVDKAIQEIAALDTSIDTAAEDQRVNALVMLLINSGKVKLVRADKGRRTTRLSSNQDFADSSHSMFDVTEDSSVTSIPYNDEGGASVRSGLSVSSSTKEKQRKSKMEKILELQTENSQMKRENKSLKKTVKKLLEQLTNLTQKEKLAVALAEKYKKEFESGAQTNVEKKEEEKQDVGDSADNTTHDMPQALGGSDADHTIEQMQQKLRDEKSAHQSTEFRLKAEIDLLTREVAGLQKELAQSLKTMEKKEKSLRDHRESTSKLKRKLSHATSTVAKLKREAEARDKLIDTFTRMLLNKIGVDGDENGSIDENCSGEEKFDLSQVEQFRKTL
eukprot:CCRYP_010467-RA/>CCRYP_010467-RA protein AED:0.33 eAED:0.33 QI:227/1/1/1/1/1/2/412/541